MQYGNDCAVLITEPQENLVLRGLKTNDNVSELSTVREKTMLFKWIRNLTIFSPVIRWILSAAVLSFILSCSFIFYFLEKLSFKEQWWRTFLIEMNSDFPKKRKEKALWKGVLPIFVQVICMDVWLFHIHWSNGSAAAANVVISAYPAYHSGAVSEQEMQGLSNLQKTWQNCQADKRFCTKLISTAPPHPSLSPPFPLFFYQSLQVFPDLSYILMVVGFYPSHNLNFISVLKLSMSVSTPLQHSLSL